VCRHLVIAAASIVQYPLEGICCPENSRIQKKPRKQHPADMSGFIQTEADAP
jgi:hypothetical protein